MSWAEVYKINSDFVNEPLNFNNYINDIAVFGADSYVMDKMNEKLFRELMSKSLTAYGHKAIHKYLYNRLTDEDVDHILLSNARLGESFNSFYRTDKFAAGGIAEVLGAITGESYNILEQKWQQGIGRYISRVMHPTWGDVWDMWTTANESLKLCIANAVAVLQGEIPSEHLDSFVNVVAGSTNSTMIFMDALAANNKLVDFFNNRSAVTILAGKSESIKAICYHPTAFTAMINNNSTNSIVFGSETAVNVIVQAITDSAAAEGVLDGIKANLSSVQTAAASLPSGEISIAAVVETKKKIDDTLAILSGRNAIADTLVSNINALTASGTAMNAIAASSTAMNAIAASATAMNKLIASDAAMTAIFTSAQAMDAICISVETKNIINASNAAMIKLMSVSFPEQLQVKYVLSLVNRTDALANFQQLSASNEVIAEVAKSSVALQLISLSSKAINAMVGSDAALAHILVKSYEVNKYFIKAVNSTISYIQRAFQTVSASSRFYNSGENYSESITLLNNAFNDRAPFGFLALGTAGTHLSASITMKMGTDVIINSRNNYIAAPRTVDASNVNGLGIKGVTFTGSGHPYYSYRLFWIR